MTTTTKPAKLNETETIIAEMLRENTGCHFLDSGSAYGRNWQRNQSIDDAMWKVSAPASLTFQWDYPELTLNVFHFLSEHLEYDATIDKILRIIEEARDTFGLETTETLFNILRDAQEEPRDAYIGGIYGEGEPMCVNTYNNEDLLSQVIQYHYASFDDVRLSLAALARVVAETEPDSIARDYWREILQEAREADDAVYSPVEPAERALPIDGCFVFLQVHGGCDVRGGYTDVRAFQDNGRTELGILDNARAAIFDTTTEGNAYHDDSTEPRFWSTDDGCHWYASGACGCGAEKQLETFPFHKVDVDAERADAIVAEAREIANSIESDERFNTDEERALYLSILAETLAELPYNRADAYRVALSLFWPAEHGCIFVDEDGTGRSPYTMGKLAASPY